MSHRHPIVAAIYDRMIESDERNFLGWLRTEVVGVAKGVVVEIGAGTGRNFPHYPAAAVQRLDAVEPDPHMRRRAEARAAEAGFPVEFVEATAERLPFAAGYADSVVVTLVLCSVDQPQQAVQEIRRVLKPRGQLLFIEHVRSDEPWRARVQDWATPVWHRIAANCHPNRATLALLSESGFEVRATHRLAVGSPWTQPVIAGVALAPP